MKKITIPKKNGGHRTIYVPSAKEKKKLRGFLPELQAIAQELDTFCVAHGFAHGRSPVTMAMAHVGYQFTLSMDLKDFFDHVSERHLQGLVDNKILKHCLVDGAARQGLPTSPVLANIAAARMDRLIVDWIQAHGIRAVYTRYADDLVISYDDPSVTSLLRDAVQNVVESIGFQINPKKTRLQSAKAGRRIICGVAVDDAGIHAPRKTRRRLRAALHNIEKCLNPDWRLKKRAEGLAEWVKLKEPLGVGPKRIVRRTKREVQSALDILGQL